MKYRVHIEYEVPMFAEVDVDANTEKQAEELAAQEFIDNNPEALDSTVVRVELI